MKFELKTEKDNFSKHYFTVFITSLNILLIILISNISFKMGNISRQYEINYFCRLLSIDKSSYNFKKLSKLLNQTSKQKIWDLCKEITK